MRLVGYAGKMKTSVRRASKKESSRQAAAVRAHLRLLKPTELRFLGRREKEN